MKRLLLCTILLTLLSVHAQKDPLTVTLERFLISEEIKDGESTELLSSAFELLPGDLFQETLMASNVSDEALEGLSLELPIPDGTYYLAESAQTLELSDSVVRPEFSFDSGSTFAYPPLYKEVMVVEDGKEVKKEVLVSPEDYTHVRWLVTKLEPEASLTASFRAVVR